MSERVHDDRATGVGRRSRLGMFIVLSIVTTVAAWMAFKAFEPSTMMGRRIRSWIRTGSDRRPFTLAENSRFPNVRPGVAFVGDAACARCHEDIARTYREHPMGRSLTPVTGVAITGGDEAPKPAFTSNGLEYTVERRGDRMLHAETKRDPAGKVVSRVEAEARYSIGSGAQAIAYVLERGDGYLFESPITWYSRKKAWDLSPGYEKENIHLERFVKPVCLFCHANRADHVDGSENRYRRPIFSGHAIGCERCHGPGELHVRTPGTIGEDAPNIVNPVALEPSLREAVCQQCHLQGDIRIVREGRELTDFRPGLPLSAIESVFVRSSSLGRTRFFGQVEQMHESRCFKGSGGKLGCISCHDPHQLPEPTGKKEYYRKRCMECHADRGCRLPVEHRMAEGRDDRCIDCHMPRSANEQVPHAATTLHLIPRLANGSGFQPEPGRPTAGGGGPLVHFHHNEIGPEERPAVARDLGIALSERTRGFPGMSPATVSRIALPLLESALAANPADGPAWTAKGTVLWQLGRREDAMTAHRNALSNSPGREETIVAAGTRASQLGKHEEAIELFARAIQINPWRADYHQILALSRLKRREWTAAIDQLRQSLALEPSNIEARIWLVQCLIGDGKTAEAREEFRSLLEQSPPDPDRLRAWFATAMPR